MMNLEQAITYGKRTGVKYYVKNSSGCIFAGCITKRDALKTMRRYEAEHIDYNRNRPTNPMKFHIEEVTA